MQWSERKKNDSKRGSVSVLLMILLSSLIFVFTILYDDAALRTMQSTVQWNGENAGNAVLTYYIPELKERYDLYGVWKEPMVLEWRMRHFAEESSPFWKTEDETKLLNAKLEEICVDPQEYLLMDPVLIRGQINNVMKQGTLIELIREEQWISGWKDILLWVGQGLKLQDEKEVYSVKRAGSVLYEGAYVQESSKEEINSEQLLLEQKENELKGEIARREEAGENAMETVKLENGKRLENSTLISELPSRQVTSTNIQRSWEILKKEPEQLMTAVQTSLMTDLYAVQYFGNYVNRQDGWFLCQLEYILQGELSDEENIEKTKRDLFFLRTAFNMAAVYRDTEIKGFVGAIASAMAPIPYPVSFGLLAAAVSAAEAGEDVKTLMNGGTIPVLKSSGDWVSLSEEMDANRENTDGKDTMNLEMDYEKHLHLLLILLPQETKILRMMDLIQLDLQRSLGESFTLNNLCGGFHWEIRSIIKNTRGKERVWICDGISKYGA